MGLNSSFNHSLSELRFLNLHELLARIVLIKGTEDYAEDSEDEEDYRAGTAQRRYAIFHNPVFPLHLNPCCPFTPATRSNHSPQFG